MRHCYVLRALLLTLCFSLFIFHSTEAQTPTIATFTAGMERRAGFLPFYYDAKKGKIWLEISTFDQELLYYPSLAQGVGSNDIGLDRGRLGQEHIVKFQRIGPKVLMIEPNYAYRAVSRDSLERRAVAESFATSVWAGFDVAAEEGNKVLVDLTPFLLQDVVGAVQAITQTRQGTYRVDASRSALYLPHSKAFPQNTEFEATITLVGENPGQYLRQVVPTPTAVTMRQHHSFVQLPDNKYKPRVFDPRGGFFGIDFYDYATPVSEPIVKRYIARHRLEKKDPTAAVSEPVKPLIYYMDPGAPEPIRSALIDGARWWNEAFEAAGFKNAFRVELLPPDADPMDIRYNLIQWVHRSTRGWSYGASVTDPRTGEIIKGKVTLGSLRVRQDYLIAQGLTGNFEGERSDTTDLMQLSLARLRQLSAHEIGHTLGMPHNYIASTNGRASVMDYPHPQVEIMGGRKLSLANAYATGIGEWDKVAINWGYRQFAPGEDEKAGLERIIQDYQRRGLKFLSDQDARPEGSAHPETHLWDGGKNAVDELWRVLEVRQIALDGFSEKKIPFGTPMANLEEVLVPMFMFHRYQTEAAVKVLGGVTYEYGVRGPAAPANVAPVAGEEQRRALNALLLTLEPATLAVPANILKLIPPRALGYDPNPREVFKRHTGVTFDALGPAEAAANLTLRLLLNPERCARLLNQAVVEPSAPGLTEVFGELSKMALPYKGTDRYYAQIRQMVGQKVVEGLITLAANRDADGRVRATAHDALMRIWHRRKPAPVRLMASISTIDYIGQLIEQYLRNPQQPVATNALTPPDGAPIDPGYEWLEPDCEWIR